MRGEYPAELPAHAHVSGFIPACAGNTCSFRWIREEHRVHPRMRGEYKAISAVGRFSVGSSPHARGILIVYPPFSPSKRFIPACAGNTRQRGKTDPAKEVHPRMRGEYGPASLRGMHLPGSSPHARGIRPKGSTKNGSSGFIPACAGNTKPSALWDVSAWVHPRMRGEYSLFTLLLVHLRGSSPHARGIPNL